MVNLKLATSKDLETVLCLLKELHAASVYASVCPFNSADVSSALLSMIKAGPKNGSIILLENEQGVLICSHMQQMFNKSEKTAVELAFWVRPEHRTTKNLKALLGAYKYWAKHTGCSSIMMGKLKSNTETETYTIRKL